MLRKNIKKIRLLLPILVAIGVFAWLARPIIAAPHDGRLFVTPAHQHVIIGSTVTIEVKADVIQSRGTVSRAYLHYDSTKLKVVKTTTANNTLGGFITDDVKVSGSPNMREIRHLAVPISRPHTGSNRPVYTITFQAIGQGNAQLIFPSTAYIAWSDNIIRSGGMITVHPPHCPPNHIGTPPNCRHIPPPAPQPPKPAPAPAPAPQPKPAPKPAPATPRPSQPTPANPTTPSADNPTTPNPAEQPQPPTPDLKADETKANRFRPQVSVERKHTRVTLQWKDTGHKKASLKYWPATLREQKDIAAQTKEVQLAANEKGVFSTTISNLTPATSYQYSITPIVEDKTTDDHYRNGFSTKGYPVKITTVSDGNPVSDVALSIEQSQTTATTDHNGIAMLELAPGDHTVVAAHGENSTTATIHVEKKTPQSGDTPDVQEFTINIEKKTTSSAPLVIGSLTLLLLGLAGGGFLLLAKKKRKKKNSPVAPKVIIEDDAWLPPQPHPEPAKPKKKASVETLSLPSSSPHLSTEPLVTPTPPPAPSHKPAAPYQPTTMPLDTAIPIHPVASAPTLSEPTQNYTPLIYTEDGDFIYYQPPQEELPENELLANLTPRAPHDNDRPRHPN